MARNRDKRSGAASGSTSPSRNEARDGRSRAGDASETSGKSGADKPGSGGAAAKAPPAANRALAAKIDPLIENADAESGASKPGGDGKSTSKGAKTAAPTASAASAAGSAGSSTPRPSSSSASATAAGSRPATSTAGGGTVGGAGGTSNDSKLAGGGFWPGLIGGVIGGAGVALAASFYLMGDNDAVNAVEGRLAAAEQQIGEINALDERVAAIEAAPAEAAEGGEEMRARLGDLETRLTALGDGAGAAGGAAFEEQFAVLEQRIEALAGEVQSAADAQQASAQALTGLESALPTLEATLAATGETVDRTTEQTAALQTNVDALGGDVQALAAKVGEAESRLDHLGGEYQRGAAMIVAIGDVDRAIASSEPFDSSLQTLKSLLRDNAVLGETLESLQSMAADGVPALADLKNTYGAMASRALLAGEGDQSLTDQVGDNVFGIINMRPSGAEAEGSDSEAVLARAQAKLSAGDLEGAVGELAALEGAAAEAANDWIERARGRLAAQAAVLDLRAHAQGLVAEGS